MTFWNDLLKSRADEWTLLHLDDPSGLPAADLLPHQAYLTVVLRSLKIVHKRVGFAKFYGTVHSDISLPVLGGTVEFTFIFTPGNQPYTDTENADRIIVVDKELLGAVPYRGGAVKLNLGLYAVKEADLAQPYLTLLQSMAGTSGVSFVSAALPFAAPLKAGIDLLMGTGKQTTLEIGLSRDFSPPKTGTYVILRAPKGTFDEKSVTVDRDGKLLDHQGRPVQDVAYVIFEVKQSPVRENWVQIPDVAKSYAQLNEAIRSDNKTRVDESFKAFRLLVLTSPDLLEPDAERLIGIVKSRLDQLFEPGLRRSSIQAFGAKLPPLNQIDLF